MPAAPRSVPVLALHGFTGGGADFAPLAAALPECTWQTPDLPGHAPDLSLPGAPGDDCRPEACIHYLDTIPLAPPGSTEVLLGYSLGGRLALRYALARPGRFAALVLIATSPGLEDAAERIARQTSDNQLAAEILTIGVPAFLEQWQQRPLIATQARLPAAWRTAMQAQRRRLRAAGLAASLRDFGQGAVTPVWNRLAELPLPVLLVAGAEDPAYVALARAMQARLPRAELLIVDGAGHLAHLENLPAFAAGLHAFLQRHRLARAGN